ncbi:MAG: glycosyltransferase family 2 protein [Planctomycetota bacterium]
MTATAVIVVNFNGGALLRKCLASVLRQEPAPAEVVVIDNASSDGSVTDLPDVVRVVHCPQNRGFAAAVNEGLRATHSPFVLTLNPDTELLPGCLAAAAAALEADYNLGSVAPRVLRAAWPDRIDATGIGLTSRLGQINLDHDLPENAVSTVPQQVLGPLGGAALWRRRALDLAGGFSESYFLYWEDVDIALRLDRAGFGCVTAPTAKVLHVGGGTVGRWSPRNVFYMSRNHWPCLLATLPGPLLRGHALAFLLAPLRAAALYASRGQALPALAGLLCALPRLPAAYHRRRRLPRSGNSLKAAQRIDGFLKQADEQRLRLKAHAGQGVRAGRNA